MFVHASVTLTQDVEDLDKADDWFAELSQLLQGKTNCSMNCQSANFEETIEIKKEQESE